MKSTKMLSKLLEVFRDRRGGVDPACLFQDTATWITDRHIVKERKQEVGGRTFVVSSFFDRHAIKTAEDKLKSLVEMDAEKEVRKAI